jgi:hypothetical protein
MVGTRKMSGQQGTQCETKNTRGNSRNGLKEENLNGTGGGMVEHGT